VHASRSTDPPAVPSPAAPRDPGGPGDFLPTRIEIDPSAYVSPAAVLLGRVTIGAEASVWPTAVLRGDYAAIEIGAESNLQDGVIVHTDQDAPCRVGARVTVGHRAVLHAATIEDDSLIGIGAILLTGVHVGSGSFVGAGAVLPEGTRIPPGSLVLGVPGRVVRAVNETLRARIERSAQNYVLYTRAYRAGRIG
jgi:carbonic anhydrase/acetyltransferase-like protein (isoleucine patch superfamily)